MLGILLRRNKLTSGEFSQAFENPSVETRAKHTWGTALGSHYSGAALKSKGPFMVGSLFNIPFRI